MVLIKPILIDSNAEMPTRRKQAKKFAGHRERLSELALTLVSDAIVRPATNKRSCRD